MKISVVVPTYNCALYVGRAIRSALDQTIAPSDYEVIVVDDGSTDRTPQVLAGFGDRIRVFRLPENRGLATARNVGIRNALGRYIVNLDADDYLHEELLRVEKLYLNLNPEFGAVACDYYVVDEKENHIERRDGRKDPIACGVMFKKENLVAIGLYDESFRMHEERDLRLRYEKNFPIHYIQLPLYRYRRHGANLTNNKEMDAYFHKKLKEKHAPPRRGRKRRG